jgi:hypothetical protein
VVDHAETLARASWYSHHPDYHSLRVSPEEVVEAIATARGVWAEAVFVPDRAGDRELADDLRRLSEELPAVTPETDVLAWSAPLDRAISRVGRLAGHDLTIKVQFSLLRDSRCSRRATFTANSS